jgi:hypothetical protein
VTRLRIAFLLFLAACSGKGADAGVDSVASVTVSVSAPQILVGATSIATAVLKDASGVQLTDRQPVWTSQSPQVLTVSATGVVTAIGPGQGTVRATSGSAFGEATVLVTNPLASSITLSRDTANISLPGGSSQIIPTVKDFAGNVLVNPTIFWSSNAPQVASVNPNGLVTGVASGTAIVRAAIDGRSATTVVIVRPTPNAAAPQITGINPTPTLRPGGQFLLFGSNFATTTAGNTVLVDGVAATVTAASATQLNVTLPTSGFACDPLKSVFVQVTANGLIGGAAATMQTSTLRTLAPGQSVIVTNPAEVRCNELANTGGRYIISVYNASRAAVNPNAVAAASLVVRGAASTATSGAAVTAPVRAPVRAVGPRWSGAVPRIGSRAYDLAEDARLARDRARVHHDILDRNIAYLRDHAAEIRASAAARRAASARLPNATVAPQVATVGTILPVKLPNLDAASFCTSNIATNARTVYVGAHSIIVEDTLSVFNGQPTLAGQMNSYYQQLGDEFETTMWPLLTTNYGNPLAMDAQLSGTGKVIMVFSPRINAMQAGRVLGFVVSCDFQPITQSPSSNLGEYFYAAVPTSTAAGYANGDTRDSWLRLMRGTVVHEVKHITAFGERLTRNVALEDASWEEGMARTVEELYARTVYGTGSKQNTGYAASIFCDLRFNGTTAGCANRPLLMLRHFDALYTYFGTPEVLSPLGRTFASDQTFYGSSWSLIRWAVDHFGVSEAQALKDFTTASAVGVVNFEGRTGRPWEESMGEWSLAMYVDDLAGLNAENPRLRFPSWNIPNLFAGMCSDLGPCTNPAGTSNLYPRANPFNPRLDVFGTFTENVGTLVGGSFMIFEISGTQAARQLFEVRSPSGGDPLSTIRIAILRVQ